MKIFGLRLSLCVGLSVKGTTAFVVQSPKALIRQANDVMNIKTGSALSAEPDTQDTTPESGEVVLTKDVWKTSAPVIVQGSTRRTWSFGNDAISRVGVFMKSQRRPVNANVELWQGPDNTPQKMSVYLQDGNMRPFSAVVETPGADNAVEIKNTGKIEFPLSAAVEAEVEEGPGTAPLGALAKTLMETENGRLIQGKAISTYPFDSNVASVQVLFMTDSRPLNARLELLQGPNNQKQVVDVYTEDGLLRPFFAVIETPGVGNVIRIINTATIEYPLTAYVEPYMFEPGQGPGEVEGDDNAGSGDFYIVD